jgi:hypothetical protein
MKILMCILILIVGAHPVSAVMVLPPTTATNTSPMPVKAAGMNGALQNYSFQNGRVDRLEREVDCVEDGFLILAVLVGSILASLCLLAIRDQLRRQKQVQENGSEAKGKA